MLLHLMKVCVRIIETNETVPFTMKVVCIFATNYWNKFIHLLTWHVICIIRRKKILIYNLEIYKNFEYYKWLNFRLLLWEVFSVTDMFICLIPLYAVIEFILRAYCVICVQPNSAPFAITILWQCNMDFTGPPQGVLNPGGWGNWDPSLCCAWPGFPQSKTWVIMHVAWWYSNQVLSLLSFWRNFAIVTQMEFELCVNAHCMWKAWSPGI